MPAGPAADTGQLALGFDAEPAAAPIVERAVVEPPVEPPVEPLAEPAAKTTDATVATAPADPAGDWRGLLDFERAWSGPLAAKQRAIRDSLGLSSARYHQLLDRALELPEALAYDPALVGRLRRVRETRRSKRFVRRVGTSG